MNVCAQNDGGTSVTLKVRSYLAFPVDVVPPVGTTISVSPSGSIFEQIGGYLNKVGTDESTRTLVAAGSEADLTFPIAANHYVKVFSDLDTEAYLASTIDSGVSLLTVMSDRLGGNPKTVLDAIGQGACATEVAQVLRTTSPVSLSDLSALTGVAVDCVSAVVDLGATGAVQGIIATTSGLIENVLQSGFLGAMIVVGGVSGATSTITVTRAAVEEAISVPVEVCSTTNYGVPSGSTWPPPVPSISVSLSPSLRGVLAAYVPDSGGPMTLAPVGWSCTAVVGGDGSAVISIKSPSDRSAIVSSYITYGTGPMYWETCPFFEPFPDPQEAKWYGPCPQSLPNYESETKLNSREAIFRIPASDGQRANAIGGLDSTTYAVLGFSTYLPSVQGSGEVSCALPDASLGICDAVISAFRDAFN